MSTTHTNAPADAGPKPHELLLKEFDERNQLTRTVTQTYIAWYTFFVSTNLAIIGLVLTNASKITAMRPYLTGLFMIVNALAIAGTYGILRANRNQDRRVREIIDGLNACCAPALGEGSPSRMSSPYPYTLIEYLLWAIMASLGVIVLFWILFTLMGPS